MKSTRKLLLAGLVLWCGPVLSNEWPTETIRIVAGFTPGGSSDLIARILAPKLSTELGVSVIVDNMPGAASTIAADYVSKAKPDGYTVLLSNISANGLAPSTYPNLSYDPVEDFDEITILGYIATVLLASPDTNVSTLEEFIEYVKARPEGVNFGSGGHATLNHVTGELLALATGLNLQHVAYRGSAEAMNDLLAGVIPFQVDALTQNVGQISAGAINALAVSTAERSDAAPDIPTFKELGYPEVETNSWAGLSMPAGTPTEVIARFSEAVVKVMDEPDVRQQYATWGMFHVASTPEEAEAFVASEVSRWSDVVASSPAFKN